MPRRSRRSGVSRRAACLAGLLLIALAGLASIPNPARGEPFRLVVTELATPLLPNSVMELAHALGYFEREGVDVTIIRVQETPLAIAALIAGDGDMANVSVDAVLRLTAREQLKAKAVVSPNRSFPYVIVAKKAIGSLTQLRGTTFGVGRVGSLDHALVREVLRAKGVNPEVLTMLSMGAPDIRLKALAAGRIDATAVSTATWSTLADRSGLHVLVTAEDFFATAPVVQKVNVVSDTVLAKRRREVTAVVTALMRASRDFAKDPDLWVSAMTKTRRDVSRAALETLAGSFSADWSVNGGLNRAELEFTAQWMWQSAEFAGLRPVRLSEWVDFSIVDETRGKIGDHPEIDPPTR